MDELAKILIGLLCGFIFLIGLYLQFKILNRAFQGIDIENFISDFIPHIFWYAPLIILLPFVILVESLDIRVSEGREIGSLLFLSYLFLIMLSISKQNYQKFYHIQDKEERKKHCNKLVNQWKSIFTFPLTFTLWVFFLVIFGEIAYFLLDGITTQDFSNYNHIITVSTSIGFLCLGFFFKSFFNVLTLFTTLMWFIWSFLVHGEVSTSPIFLLVLDSVGEVMPIWVKSLYIFLALLYALFTTFKNLSSEDVFSIFKN